MKSYYTIGETAKLLGVTTQTLRHYEKIGILQPRKIDSHTGYRYYSFDQFHIIDRVKYLQGLGLHLNDIGQIIKKGPLPAFCLPWKKNGRNPIRNWNRFRTASKISNGTSNILPISVK